MYAASENPYHASIFPVYTHGHIVDHIVDNLRLGSRACGHDDLETGHLHQLLFRSRDTGAGPGMIGEKQSYQTVGSKADMRC
jgi:hypothetical protein